MHRTFIKLILLTLFIALTGGLVYIPSAQGGTEAEMHTYYLPNFVWHKYFLNSSIILNNTTNTDTIATLIFTPLPVGAPTQVLYSLTAHQTLLVDDRNLFLSLPGVYTVRILADQEVESLVNIYRVRGNALSTYRGLPDEGKTELFFGSMNPLTWATIQNVSYNIALGTMNLYDYSGSLVSSNPYTISPLGLFSRNSSTVPVVPDFQGWMAAVGDQSIVGIISQKVQLPSGEIRFNSMRPALSKGEVIDRKSVV